MTQPLDAPTQIKFRQDGEPDGRGLSEGSKATRFSAGDGRKRPGRPKGKRSEKSELDLVKAMKVEVTIGGKTKRVNTRLAYMLRQRDKALKGDAKAIEWLDRKFGQYEPPVVDRDATEALLAEDEAILADAAKRGLIDSLKDDGATS